MGCKPKEMKALDVFTALISFIKGKIQTEFRKSRMEVKNINIEDMYWVLTTPEMKAEQFIRDAVTKVRILNSHINHNIQQFWILVFYTSLRD